MSDYPFSRRDPICVSHYPPPYQTIEPEEAVEFLALENPNKTRSKNAVLYVHVPFCDHICSFCPFNKSLKSENKVATYLELLNNEIDRYSDTAYVKSTNFGCLALGGGTPSALTSEQLCSIISTCKKKFNLNKEPEISVEGNPSNYSADKLKASFEAGVNRVSFGVQTFNSELGKYIDLPHSSEQAIEAIENSHALGCNNVGVDLIYNLPGQTLDQWKNDLKTSIDLELEHITIFSLISPPFTKLSEQLRKGELPPAGDLSKEIEMYKTAEETLLSAGYEQYSVYDFALPNKVNLHALYYFGQQEDLLGLGPAAFGYFNDLMYINCGRLSDYQDLLVNGNYPILYGEKATSEEKIHAFVAKGLRLLKISKKLFEDKFGEKFENKFAKQIDFLLSEKLIEITDEEIRLTAKGRIWGNNICKMFFSDKFINMPPIEREVLARGIVRKEKKHEVIGRN